MTNKKYYIRDDGRIVALKDFGNIKAGDVGGFVESEDNLSHEGECWIYEDARVSGDAWVFGNARVAGDAAVSGNAWVYGDASVSGNAKVFEDAKIAGNARVSEDAKVFEDAKVAGNARVYKDARVSGNAWVYGKAITTSKAFTVHGPKDHITVTDNYCAIGCENYPHEHWLENIEAIGKKHKYTDQEIEVYKALVFTLIQKKQRELADGC